MLWNTPNSGEPIIAARARCLIMMIINITAVAEPAAIGIDLNKISVASPLKLPVAAKTAHLRCLRSITSALGVRGYFFRRGLAAGRVGQEVSPRAILVLISINSRRIGTDHF